MDDDASDDFCGGHDVDGGVTDDFKPLLAEIRDAVRDPVEHRAHICDGGLFDFYMGLGVFEMV